MFVRNTTLWGLLATTLFLISFVGCSKAPLPSYAPQIDPSTAGKAALQQYDANKDGKISGQELDKAASLKSNLARIDKNNDKALTADEIAERIAYLQKSDLNHSPGRVSCFVYRNKLPLAGAEIKLVPEKFMGDSLKVVTGKTDSHGTAVLASEPTDPDKPPHVTPGFYQVQITKTGENIPPRYNTNTTLGIDTSMDSANMYMGARFYLQY